MIHSDLLIAAFITLVTSGIQRFNVHYRFVMLSQLFILSPRGEVIIKKDFLGNVPSTSAEIFYRKLRFWKENMETPPIFMIDGVTYIHTKEESVVLVATTLENISPLLVLELLKRFIILIKDYCGVVSEESIKKNFILIYELLDEVLDYGFPQTTSTNALKSFIQSEPISSTTIVSGEGMVTFGLQKAPTGVFKSVLDMDRTDGKRREEIFVDIIERVTSIFSSTGFMQSSQIDGSIQIRSYLNKNPTLKMKLNDNICIRQSTHAIPNDPIVLEDCQFHECAKLDLFETDRSITFVPALGEFTLMNYRCTSGIRPLFVLSTLIESDPLSPFKGVVTLDLLNDIPRDKTASTVEVEVPMPKSSSRVHCELLQKGPEQNWEYNEKTHVVTWTFKDFKGSEKGNLIIRATLEKAFGSMFKREVGPINVKFTIPGHSASRLNLQYLDISKLARGYNPQKWFRYVATSTSYTFRT